MILLNWCFWLVRDHIEQHPTGPAVITNSQFKILSTIHSTINVNDINEDIVFDEETQKWAENVKRRLSKRKTYKDKDDFDEGVMIGTRIGEDHVNYVLMYNMLTGIRVGVSL